MVCFKLNANEKKTCATLPHVGSIKFSLLASIQRNKRATTTVCLCILYDNVFIPT